MLYYFLPILFASFLLSAATLKEQKALDISITLYGLSQTKTSLDDTIKSIDAYLEKNHTDKDTIAFFSAFNQSKANVVTGYNYVYALHANNGLRNAPLIASNLPISSHSQHHQIYDFSTNKTHAKVYVKTFSDQKVAFLSLIDLERSSENLPSDEDIKKLGSTIDRGAIEGWNKVVLVSQYSPSSTQAILEQLKGIDIAITLGSKRNVTWVGKTCLAEFPYNDINPNQKAIKASFSASGYTTQCHW